MVFDLERPLFVTVQSEFARIAPRGGAVIHAFKQLDSRQTGDADPNIEYQELSRARARLNEMQTATAKVAHTSPG